VGEKSRISAKRVGPRRGWQGKKNVSISKRGTGKSGEDCFEKEKNASQEEERKNERMQEKGKGSPNL